MTSIIYVGLDVHSTNYTACCYDTRNDRTFAVVQMEPDYKNIIKYLDKVEKEREEQCRFICGYEAGCLGYTLYHQLTDHGIECVILAPSTMPVEPGNRIKTDKRDAEKISRCLAYNTYSAVYVPDQKDEAIKDYIRLRDDVKTELKRTKQQINAFCLRHDLHFAGKTKWTNAHLSWLNKVDTGDAILNEILQEYLVIFYTLSEKISVYDARINEFSIDEKYSESVRRLCCFLGISVYGAMALLCEIGDFKRFPSAKQFAAYLGLVPGENSSGGKQHRLGITKAGNIHIRHILVEVAQSYTRGSYVKGKTLQEKQQGNSSQIIAYADKANERLKRKYRRLIITKNTNVAKTAIARELACFIWGMMTENFA